MSNKGHKSVNMTEFLTNNDRNIEQNPMINENILPTDAFNHDPIRGKWEYKWDFFCAILGNMFGIRSFCLMHYFYTTCGGGAFLIPVVFIMLPGVLMPLIHCTIFGGQFSSTGFLSIYRLVPVYKGFGHITLILNCFSTIYFAVIGCYPLAMLYKTLNYKAIWEKDPIQFVKNFTHALNDSFIDSNFDRTNAPSIYLLQKTQELHSGWNDSSLSTPLMIMVTIFWIATAICLIKGVKYVSKVVRVTSVLGLILLLTISFRSMGSFGFVPGANFFAYTNFSKLGEFRSWAASVILVYHFVGQSFGTVLTMASYNNLRDPINDICWYMPSLYIMGLLLGIFAIKVVIKYLYIIGMKESVATRGGFNLAFIMFPDFIKYVNENQVWSAFFYLMLFCFEFHHIVIQVLAIQTSIFDEYAKLRKVKIYITVGLCTVFAAIGVYFASKGIFAPCDKLMVYGIISQMVITFVELKTIYLGSSFTSDYDFVFGRHFFKKYLNDTFLTVLFLMGFIWFCIEGMPNLPPANPLLPNWLIITFFVICCIYIILYASKHLYKPGISILQSLCMSYVSVRWHPAENDDHLKYLMYKIQKKEEKLKQTALKYAQTQL